MMVDHHRCCRQLVGLNLFWKSDCLHNNSSSWNPCTKYRPIGNVLSSTFGYSNQAHILIVIPMHVVHVTCSYMIMCVCYGISHSSTLLLFSVSESTHYWIFLVVYSKCSFQMEPHHDGRSFKPLQWVEDNPLAPVVMRNYCLAMSVTVWSKSPDEGRIGMIFGWVVIFGPLPGHRPKPLWMDPSPSSDGCPLARIAMWHCWISADGGT